MSAEQVPVVVWRAMETMGVDGVARGFFFLVVAVFALELMFGSRE